MNLVGYLGPRLPSNYCSIYILSLHYFNALFYRLILFCHSEKEIDNFINEINRVFDRLRNIILYLFYIYLIFCARFLARVLC